MTRQPFTTNDLFVAGVIGVLLAVFVEMLAAGG